MTRLAARLLGIVVLLGAAPGAEAKKRVSPSHVPACAAMVGEPCKALMRNWRLDMTVLVALKGVVK